MIHTTFIPYKIRTGLLLLLSSAIILGLNTGCESWGHVLWLIENDSKEPLEFSIDLKSQKTQTVISIIEKDTIFPKGTYAFPTYFGLGFSGYERDTIFGLQKRGSINMKHYVNSKDPKDHAYLMTRIRCKLGKRRYPLVSIKWKNLTGTYTDSITYPYYVLKKKISDIILPSGELIEYVDEAAN